MVILPDEMIDDVPSPVPQRRRTGRVVALAAVVLLSGVAIGVGATLMWKQDKAQTPPPGRDIPPFAVAADIAKDIAERHALTDPQRGEVEVALTDSLEQMRLLRTDYYEKIGTNHEQLREAFKTIMTPEQFTAWSDHFEERRRRWSEAGRRRGSRETRNGDSGTRQRMSWSNRPKGPRLVRMFDTDNDGQLTLQELPESLRETMAAADADGDQLITGEELSLWLGEDITPPPPAPSDEPQGEAAPQ